MFILWIDYDSVIVQAVTEFFVFYKKSAPYLTPACALAALTRSSFARCGPQPKEVRLWTLVPVAIYAA